MHSLPPKTNALLILAKTCWKIKLSRISLFHIKTRVSLKYFVSDCIRKQYFGPNSPQTGLNVMPFTVHLYKPELVLTKPTIIKLKPNFLRLFHTFSMTLIILKKYEGIDQRKSRKRTTIINKSRESIMNLMNHIFISPIRLLYLAYIHKDTVM